MSFDIINGVCLRYFYDVMMWYHDQDNLLKKDFIGDMLCQTGESIIILVGSMAPGR